MSDEAHLSAEQTRAQAASRLPVPHGDPGRPEGSARPPRTRPQVAERLSQPKDARPILTIGKRADFLAANKGQRVAMPGFVLLVHDRLDGDAAKRIGITVTKKIGGAVVRNRMKRRFRALARELLPELGKSGADHVLIGRAGGVERDFGLLRAEMVKALRKTSRPVGAEPVQAAPFEKKRSPSAASGQTVEKSTGAGASQAHEGRGEK